MAFLDVRTVYFVLGMLYVVMPIVTWMAMARDRSRPVHLWCLGGLGYGIAITLIAMRGSIPDWVSFAVANAFLNLSSLLRIQAIRIDLNIPWRSSNIVRIFLLFMVVFEFNRSLIHSDVLRLQWAFGTFFILLFCLAYMAWRLSHFTNSQSAKWIALVYLLFGFAIVYRFVDVSLGRVTPGLMVNNVSEMLSLLFGIISSIFGHFGYMGISLDRSIADKIESAATLARQQENQLLSSQIAQLDRQRALGVLSASVGHELNQPLSAILANAQAIEYGLQNGLLSAQQVQECVQPIIINTRRARQIIEKTHDFIRPNALQKMPVNLVILVRDVAKLLSQEASQLHINFHFAASADDIEVEGDELQLSQVLLNLYRNAMEAMRHAKEKSVFVQLSRNEGQIHLRIIDTGPGLTEQALQTVGTPFFTTKAEGLGLGLSISQNIIEQHHGQLGISNANAGGARVDIYLPVLAS
jgi:C4-dicarboxylate-specific signal transduction histidine kinase